MLQRNEAGTTLIETVLVLSFLLGLITYSISLSRSTYIRSSIQQQAETITSQARGKLRESTSDFADTSGAALFLDMATKREEILRELSDKVLKLLPVGVKLAEIEHVDIYPSSSTGTSSRQFAALLFPGSSAKITSWNEQMIHHSHKCTACTGSNRIDPSSVSFKDLLNEYPAEMVVAYESDRWPLSKRQDIVRVPFYLTIDAAFIPGISPGDGPGTPHTIDPGYIGSVSKPNCNRFQYLFNDRLCSVSPVPGISADACSALDKEECGPKLDEKGAPVFEVDAEGKVLLDAKGNPHQVKECKTVSGVCPWSSNIAGRECFEENTHCYSSFPWLAPQYGDPFGQSHRKTFKCAKQCLDGAPGQWTFNDRLCSTRGSGGAGSCGDIGYECPIHTNVAGQACNEINKLCYSSFSWSAPQWGDYAGTHHRKVFKCLTQDFRSQGRMVFNDRACAMTPRPGSAGPCNVIPECKGTRDVAGTSCNNLNENCYSKFGWPFPEHGDPTGENHRKVFKCLPWVR
jgi:hypothetical protein